LISAGRARHRADGDETERSGAPVQIEGDRELSAGKSIAARMRSFANACLREVAAAGTRTSVSSSSGKRTVLGMPSRDRSRAAEHALSAGETVFTLGAEGEQDRADRSEAAARSAFLATTWQTVPSSLRQYRARLAPEVLWLT